MDFDTALPASLRIDVQHRRVRLDPRDPAFVQNPYAAYAAIRQACPFLLLGRLRPLVRRPPTRRSVPCFATGASGATSAM